MNNRRPSRPTVQNTQYLGQLQHTPATRTPQAAHHTIPPLNSTIQARYQTLTYPDRAGLPLTGASQTAGVSSPFSAPVADPGLQFQANVPSSPSFADYLISALRPMFAAHQESTSARIDQIGNAIETLGLTVGDLSTQIKDVRKEAQEQTKEAAGLLERTHEVQFSTSRVLAARLAKLEKMIGTSNDRDDKRSLLNRLDTITYAVEELVERAKDPDAPLSDISVRLGTETDSVIDLTTPGPQESKTYVDAAVDPRTSEPNPRTYIDTGVDSRTPEPAPVHYANPAKQLYRDAATDSRTPEPAPIRYEIGTGTVHQVYADAAIHPKTPETLPPHPVRQGLGTSPVHQSYLDVAIGPRTPSPFVSMRGSAHLSGSSTRRFSSGALTFVGDATDLEIKLPIGLVHNAEAGTVPMDEDSSGTPGMKPRSLTAPIQAHFKHVPGASKSLSPADWSIAEEAHQTPVSDDIDVFHLDASPSATEGFTLLKGELNSQEGSVRSPRLSTLGDSLASPTAFPPRCGIPNIPIPSRSSVSPLSPYSLSPSCSPHMLSPRRQIPQSPRQSTPIESRLRTTTPKRSYAQAAPSPVQMSTPESVPTLAQTGAVNGIPSTPAFKTPFAHAASHLVPVMTSTPVQTSTQGSVDQIQETLLMSSPKSQPVSPNLVEEEISVSQLITETFTSLETPLIVNNLTSPPQNYSSAPTIDSPTAPGEPPERSTPPSSPPLPPKVITRKLPLPRRPPHPKSPTNPPFINLRGSPIIKACSSHDFQSPHLALTTTKPIRTPRTPRLPRASTSKATANSPIYISSRSLSPVTDLTSQSESDDDVKVIPVKKKVKTEHLKSELSLAKKKYLIVKVDPPEKESAAATRVKKRKVKPSDVASEPPLKRARQKAEVVKGEIVEIDRKGFDSKAKAQGKEVKGKGKEIKGGDSKKGARGKFNASSTSSAKDTTKARTKPLPGSEWPPKSQAGGAKFHQKFIECESCYYWYHYGCVGIKPGDRMAGARDFVCPPCSSNGANPLVPSGKGVVCARPDCGEASVDEFFVAGIIGRATKVEGGRGRRYLWLVKWEGYPINQSTWEEEDAMSDPQNLVEDFIIAAEKEGLPDDPHITLLLKEAVRGGCVDPNA